MEGIFWCWILQFIFDLPQRLRKCVSAENYGAAVKYYQGALPILKVLTISFNLLETYRLPIRLRDIVMESCILFHLVVDWWIEEGWESSKVMILGL